MIDKDEMNLGKIMVIVASVASFQGSFTTSAQENDYFTLFPLLRSFKHETTYRYDFVWKLAIF